METEKQALKRLAKNAEVRYTEEEICENCGKLKSEHCTDMKGKLFCNLFEEKQFKPKQEVQNHSEKGGSE